jgi:hypothetical protein
MIYIIYRKSYLNTIIRKISNETGGMSHLGKGERNSRGTIHPPLLAFKKEFDKN